MNLTAVIQLASEAVNSMTHSNSGTAKQLFLNETSNEIDIVLKYCPYEAPFHKPYCFKYDKSTLWQEAEVVPKLSKSLYKIHFHEKFHIRTINEIKCKKTKKQEISGDEESEEESVNFMSTA